MRLAKQPQTLSRLPLPPQVRSQSIIHAPHCRHASCRLVTLVVARGHPGPCLGPKSI